MSDIPEPQEIKLRTPNDVKQELIKEIDIKFDNLAESLANIMAEYEYLLKMQKSLHLKKIALKHNKLAMDMNDILYITKIELSKCIYRKF